MKNKGKEKNAGKPNRSGKENKADKVNEVKNGNTPNDTEELNTIINDGTSKDSTGATINAQRLSQDDSYSVNSETTEGKRNKELLNEPYVGAADQTKLSVPGEVETIGEK